MILSHFEVCSEMGLSQSLCFFCFSCEAMNTHNCQVFWCKLRDTKEFWSILIQICFCPLLSSCFVLISSFYRLISELCRLNLVSNLLNPYLGLREPPHSRHLPIYFLNTSNSWCANSSFLLWFVFSCWINTDQVASKSSKTHPAEHRPWELRGSRWAMPFSWSLGARSSVRWRRCRWEWWCRSAGGDPTEVRGAPKR